MHAEPEEVREDVRLPGTGMTGFREQCEYWELKSGPLEEKPVLFTTEPPLQTQFLSSLKKGLCIYGNDRENLIDATTDKKKKQCLYNKTFGKQKEVRAETEWS